MQKNMSDEIPFICICVYVNAEDTFAYVYMNMDKNIEALSLGSPYVFLAVGLMLARGPKNSGEKGRCP